MIFSPRTAIGVPDRFACADRRATGRRDYANRAGGKPARALPDA